MKINNIASSGINPYKRQMNKLDQVKKGMQNTADKLEISSTAKEMQQVSQLSLQRQERVNELKTQVNNGAYNIDPKKVANSVINFYLKN